MPLCGFNDKMITGLRMFGEGLFDQAEERAKIDCVSLRTSFDNEVSEMDVFLRILSEKEFGRFQSLIGITHLSQALYKSGLGLDDPKETFLKKLEASLKFFVELDNKYYAEFRPGTDPVEALEKLGHWLEQ